MQISSIFAQSRSYILGNYYQSIFVDHQISEKPDMEDQNFSNTNQVQDDWAEANQLEEREKLAQRELLAQQKLTELRRQEAINRGDDYVENDQDTVQDEEMADNRNWISVARKVRRYKASINVKHVTGTTNNQKLRKVQEAIADLELFFGIKLHNYNKEQYILAEFGDKTTMETACTRCIEEGSEFRLSSILNRGDDEIKNRTLVVRDLPLNMEKNILKKILERKAGVEVTDIKTKVTGPWMTAHVTFQTDTAINALKDVWSIPYLKDLVRIAPANVTGEEIEQRNKWTAKLTSLPFGITAFDLKDIILATKAKICFIPRTRDKYTRLRYAFFSFKEESEMEEAVHGINQYEIKGQPLVWAEADKKTCHKCGSVEHLVKDCEEREYSQQRKQQLTQFKKVYTRYRVPNYKRINRIGNPPPPRKETYDNYQPGYQNRMAQTPEANNNNRDHITEQGRGNFDNEERTIYNMLKEIRVDMEKMKTEMHIICNRINKLEGKETVSSSSNKSTLDKGKAREEISVPVTETPRQSQRTSSPYRTRHNSTRNFAPIPNTSNKRGALESEGPTSTSTPVNIHKARKREFVQNPNQDRSSLEEINDLKTTLNHNSGKMNELGNRVDRMLEMLEKRNTPNAGGPSTSQFPLTTL